MELKNRIALITGAGQGIGKAIALEFAKEGAHIIASDVNVQTATDTANEITASGREALVTITDVSNGEEVRSMVKRALEKFGRIDILVNNAGTDIHRRVSEMEEEVWDKVLNVNLKGVFLCSREVVGSMMKHRYGRIVNMSSVYAVTAGLEVAHYSASKAGVIGFTKALAREAAPYNITVNAIAPGSIDTPFLRRMLSDEHRRRVVNETPLRRIGTPEDVANMALFLVSDRANFVTGQTIIIDGGWHLK